jgi:hypothetical protein
MSEPQEVLNCPMQPNDANAVTVRDYLVAIVRQVWREGEDFSGKRPFGNSSWEHEIFTALGKNGLIDVQFDEYGYIHDFDRSWAHHVVLDAIDQLGACCTE